MTRGPGAATSSALEQAREDLAVWRRLAPSGLLLVGAAASVIADAATRKARRAPAPAWVAEGTAGLTLLGAGLSLFGEAVKRRALHDVVARAADG